MRDSQGMDRERKICVRYEREREREREKERERARERGYKTVMR
jgi:hypothetical protein